MIRCVTLFLLITLSLTASSQGRSGLHPDYLQLQYGGSIGFLSFGAGYRLLNNKAIAGLHFGHVPVSMGGELNIFSTKFLFVPRRYPVGEKFSVAPYTAGLMISYHLGSDFRSRWPSHRYPESYYWWQTSFRFHLNYQPSVTYSLHDHTIFKSVTGYLDVNSNELYLVSFFQNTRSLRLWDVLKLGAGVRLNY